ncbi:hypothetical protein PGT21_009597 [Puccinia graminis f. sp. tritici]|uniref:Uncharacterized protein n=2 Tax=Puccinia graminis f. sp. tritici TaxID=56615 RepID=E3KMC5_PUCGT|nr:uncharacterized protein PGTG_11806 [Puccinia graminis f. sp. tritici CRL 75-36-700-3]EFP85450.2 hypothetical protein PGTG_11806 [Puccinia graminis f. sp. tritici CRL 75-36-700-3]KAA1074546.1 hypothetical protein PGT21_009597 [Puccinia graminis f. sp. tritici]KAA1116031.1 hypothetical protein PGTUg99_033061 [Puccinia graminis f. sp. tritici]
MIQIVSGGMFCSKNLWLLAAIVLTISLIMQSAQCEEDQANAPIAVKGEVGEATTRITNHASPSAAGIVRRSPLPRKKKKTQAAAASQLKTAQKNKGQKLAVAQTNNAGTGTGVNTGGGVGNCKAPKTFFNPKTKRCECPNGKKESRNQQGQIICK